MTHKLVRPLLTTLFLILTTFTLAQPLHAQTLQSSNYKIRMGNFNITSGTKTSSSYSLTDTVGQTVAHLFSSSGYAVKAGFQYIYTLYDFSFSISNLSIDLGTLTPNTFSTTNNTLTVNAPGQGYSVSTYAINRLKSQSNYINNTTCDTSSCTQTDADPWTSTSVTGFGYNANGNDVSSDFVDTTYFRPFPDLSAGDSPAMLMSTTQAGKNRQATITYQANINGDQPSGNYTTQIVYIATPTY